jgi:hypothetical protein
MYLDMGKTRRHSPEGEDFIMVSHRIPRKDIAIAEQDISAHLLALMADDDAVLDRYVELPPIDTAAERSQDRVLDLLHAAGEQMLADVPVDGQFESLA